MVIKRLVPTVLNTRLLLWAPLGYKKKRVETHIHVSRPSFTYPLSLPFWNHAFENPIHIRVLFPVEMDQTKRVKDYATDKYQNYQIFFFLFSQTIASSSVKLNTDISITM